MSTTTTNGNRTSGNGGDPAKSRKADPSSPNPLLRLTDEQLAELGREFDELHDQVKNDLGDRDATYIHSMIGLQRRLALMGRVEMFGARSRPLWLLGTATLGLAKILENMEIGHNVLHGQWDWMNHPVINSRTWDWDTASTAEAWRHSHNYIHHTYTNIRGKDKDLGYEIMRIDPAQKWHPVYLFQPFYNLLLMAFFEWGVAAHDLDLEAIRAGEKSMDDVREDLKGMGVKARGQIQKDYIAWPLLSALISTGVEWAIRSGDVNDLLPAGHRSRRGRLQAKASQARVRVARRAGRKVREPFNAVDSFASSYKSAVTANFWSNIIRNCWSHAIIFCGHFPDQTYTFSEDEVRDEQPGGRYVRQLLGAANIEGSPLFHVISGNLGYQVEHHLYPDMPSTRYGEIAPRVREICRKYDLPYNSGPFGQQWYMVMRTIARLGLPGGSPRPKPGPYRGETYLSEGERDLVHAAERERGEK
jgi:fatty acid desaturase